MCGWKDESTVIVTSAEKEGNVSYCQYVGGEYAKEITSLTHRLLHPDARAESVVTRACRLQELVFVNLPHLCRVLELCGAMLAPSVSTEIKKQLPLAHAIVTHFELSGALAPPCYHSRPVARRVLKFALCEYCFYPRVLFSEDVPAGELAFGQADCLNGYARRTRQVEHWCPRCAGDRRPGRRLLQREAVLRRLRCHHCKQLIIVIEAVPLGEPCDGPLDAIKNIESYAGRFRRHIHSQCTCGRDCRLSQSGAAPIVPSDVRFWINHIQPRQSATIS